MARIETGLLSQAAENKIGKEWLDSMIKAGIFEMIDGEAFAFAIRSLDNKFGARVPEPLQTQIRTQFDVLVLEEDPGAVIEELLEKLDEALDIGFLNDEEETLMFEGFIKVIKAWVIAIKRHLATDLPK